MQSEFIKSFQKEFSNLLPTYKKESIAIAVSGGADSMCLALLMQNIATAENLYVIIVDHSLRQESAQEASDTKDFLDKKGFQCQILTWQGAKPNSNIQNYARELRYELLIKFCKKNNINHLLTAHTFDDQAETVLMRVLRGSGTDGLSGIPQKTIKNDIQIIRPLLAFKRTDIELFLKENNWQWVNDPSNENTNFDRVKIRRHIKSLEKDFPEIKQRLNLVSANMVRLNNFLQGEVLEATQKCFSFEPEGYAILKINEFLILPEEIALRCLKNTLLVIGNKKEIRLKCLKELYSALQRQISTKTLGNCVIQSHQGVYLIYPELNTLPEVIEIAEGQTIEWGNFIITNKKDSGVVKPLGKGGLDALKREFLLERKHYNKPLFYTFPTVYYKHLDAYFCPFIVSEHKAQCDIKLNYKYHCDILKNQRLL